MVWDQEPGRGKEKGEGESGGKWKGEEAELSTGMEISKC